MKRFFLILSIIAFSVGITFPQSIVVSSPHSGDIWYKVNSYSISWVKIGSQHESVKIRLYDSTGSTRLLEITNSTPNNGNFGPYTIPGSIAEGRYIIRVRTLDNLVSDDSAIFSIAESSITITSPRENETFHQGETINIDWTTTGLSAGDNVDIVLHNTNSPEITYPICFSFRNDRSPYRFRIPYTVVRGSYRISINHGEVLSQSGKFQILTTDPPRVTIEECNVQDEQIIGSRIHLRWSSNLTDPNSRFFIDLFRNGKFVGLIDGDTTSRTDYVWDCKTLSRGEKIIPAEGYSITVCNSTPHAVCGSTRTFTLKNFTRSIIPRIVVLTPKYKNQTWDVGTYKTIKWNSFHANGRIIRIDIFYGLERRSEDSYTHFQIANSIPANQNSFRWHVGYSVSGIIALKLGTTHGIKIRIMRDDGGIQFYDWSKSFNIRNLIRGVRK